MAKTVMSELVVKMTAETAQLKAEMERVRKSVDQTAKNMSAEFAKSQTSIVNLAASFKKLAVAIGAMAIIGKVKTDLVNTLVQFDSLERQLKFITKSSGDAKQALAALTQEAARTPFTVAELTEAYIKLRQRGLDASLEAMRAWGNVAAASQKPLQQMIEAVLDAVTGEGERLKEFGITMQQQGDQVALTFGQTTLVVEKSAASIQAALLKIAEINFAGAMEEQAGGLAQMFSNVEDSWQQLMRVIGDLGAFSALSAALSGTVKVLDTISLGFRKLAIDFEYAKKLISIIASWDETDFGPARIGDAMAAAAAERNRAVEALKTTTEQALPAITKTAQVSRDAAEGITRMGDAAEKTGKKARTGLNVPYSEYISLASKLTGVDEALIAGLIRVESGFNKMAVSVAGARGLMQVMPAAAKDMHVAFSKMFDPKSNILTGAAYFQWLLKETGGNVREALSAYNQGLGNLEKNGIINGKYVDNVLRFAAAYSDGGVYVEGMTSALEANTKAAEDAKKAAEDQAKALETLDQALADLIKQQQKYVQGLQDEAQAAADAYLSESDPAAYEAAMKSREHAAVDAAAATLALSEADLQAAHAAVETKYAYQDMTESLTQREGWAKSIVDGFDDLWNSMGSGAENAMDALEKTLKSWVLSIGQWLLKQALIIPITARMFGVNEQALGGGFFGGGSNGGLSHDAAAIVKGVAGVQDEASRTADAVGDVGKTASSVGGGLMQLLGSLFSGTWQFLAAIITALTGGSFAQAADKLSEAGDALGTGQGGFLGQISKLFGGTSIGDSIGLGIEKLGETLGSGWLEDLGAAAFANAIPNWGTALAGAAGAAIGSMFGGYGSVGGGLGSTIGTALGAAVAGPIGAAIGAAIGGLAGGALGGLFGQTETHGGVTAYDVGKGGYIPGGHTDMGMSDAVNNMGQFLDQANALIKEIYDAFGAFAGNMAGGYWVDVRDETGRTDAAYNSYLRGMQKQAGFGSEEEAMNWIAGQIMEDVKSALGRVSGPMADVIGDMFSNIMGGEGQEQALNYLKGASEGIQSVMADFKRLPAEMQKNVPGIIMSFAKTWDDVAAIVEIATQVQGQYGVGLWETVNAVKEMQQGNEGLAETYSRVVAQFDETQAAMFMLGKGLMTFSIESLKFSDALAQAAGGLQNLQQLQGVYFENFYTDAERMAAGVAIAQQAIDAFNQQLGRTGDAAIDTRDELRAYIESLDLNTDAGRQAYVAALELAQAILMLDPAAQAAGDAATDAGDSLEELAQKLSEIMAPVRDVISQFVGDPAISGLAATLRDVADRFKAVWESAKNVGAGEAELAEIRTAAAIQMGEAIVSAIDAAPDVESWLELGRAIDANKNALADWLRTLGYTDDQLAQYWEYLKQQFIEAGVVLYDSLQDALQTAIDKTLELQIAWQQFQLDIETKIAALSGGSNAAGIYAAGEEMYATYAANWNKMSLDAQLAAVQQMIGMVDAWVSAATAEVQAALQAQINAINEAADAQIEAINAQIEALNEQLDAAQEARDAVAEQYQDQIDAINETLEALEAWISVAENLQNIIDSIQYSTANPVPLPGQLASMQAAIASMWTEFLGAAPEDQAALADELAQMLQQYLQLAGQVYQVPSQEYQDIYTYVMQMLSELQAIAQPKADEALALQEQLNDLTEEMNDTLKAMDDALEALRDETEAQTEALQDQIDAVNESRDAQIAAAEAAAQAQIDAINAQAKALYEEFGRIGDEVYQQMIADSMSEQDILMQQLDVLWAIYKEMVDYYNTQWQPGVTTEGPGSVSGTGPGSVGGVPQYAQGTPYVPADGLAYLHRGEQVIPAGAAGEPKITINLGGVVVHGGGDERKIKIAIRQGVEEMLPYIKRNLKHN